MGASSIPRASLAGVQFREKKKNFCKQKLLQSQNSDFRIVFFLAGFLGRICARHAISMLTENRRRRSFFSSLYIFLYFCSFVAKILYTSKKLKKKEFFHTSKKVCGVNVPYIVFYGDAIYSLSFPIKKVVLPCSVLCFCLLKV